MKNVTENQRRYEEETHKRHAEIRAAVRAGDGTIEFDEEANRRARAIHYRAEQIRKAEAEAQKHEVQS